MALEVLKRVIVLGVVCVALASLSAASKTCAAFLFAAGVAIYFAFPSAARPPQALIYERGPAVYGPDFVGFFLTSVFVALPFWARMGEADLWAEFGVLVHPSALLTWPLALVAVSILWFSARYAAFWLVIEDEGLRINRLEGTHFIAFAAIAEVRPTRRGLPKWVRWLTPLLIAAGKFGAAGSILLARDSVGITLAFKDGGQFTIAEEAFEKPLRRVVTALRKHHVSFADGKAF